MTTTDISIFTESGFATTMKIADAMVKSGILPRGIDNPFKAFAIIQKGREMGVEPMRALTGIYLIEGKTVVSPELKLECFKNRGGKVQWVESTNAIAHVKLTGGDGGTHEEIVTMQDMASAGLAGKDNWRKYPKSMLRARCIAFALRAMGEGDGSYNPDELGAVTNEAGEPEYTPPTKESSWTRTNGTSATHAETRSATVTAPTHVQPASASIASATPTTSANGAESAAPSTNASATKPRTAADVPYCGTPLSPQQLKLIHVLRGQIGGVFSGDEEDARTNWGKALRVYRNAAGERITTSKDMCRTQATHLIERMEGYVRKQGERAAQGFTPPAPTVGELYQRAFGDSDEGPQWLHGLFNVEHPQELSANDVDTAMHLLPFIGKPEYDERETAMRATGRVR